MAKETLRHFENACVLTKYANKTYLKDFTEETFRPGNTINIPKPARFSVTSGAVASFPDITEEQLSLTVSQQNVSFAPLSIEMTNSVYRDEWSERYIKPMAIALANKVDADGFAAILTGVGNWTGTAGTVPSSISTYLTGKAIQNELACPQDNERSAVVSPAAEAAILDALKGLFHSGSDIEKQYKEGMMGMAFGLKWSMDQNVGTHTTGQQGGTPLVNGASQTGTSLITNGWTASAANRLKAGDVFTIAGVFAVNPVTKNSTGRLQGFTATADAASDGSGNSTLSIFPAIVVSGTTQNVSGSPASGAAINLTTPSVVQSDNVVFHKDALTIACIPMATYGGLDKSAVEYDPDTGIAVRITQGMDVTNDKLLCRADVLYGWAVPRYEWITRIVG